MKQAYGKKKRLTKKSRALIEQIDSIVSEYAAMGMRITVRQVYYQCVARSILDNTKANYDKISDILADGRMAGLIDWCMIEDRTRYKRANVHWESPQQIIEAAAEEYRIDTRITQPVYVEAWIEKDSLVSILEGICFELDVPCFSCRGYPSITSLYEAAERFRNKQNAVILYAGDHDPSGLKIPKVINERLQDFGVNVQLQRIGLTLEQIQEFILPPYYAKEKDKNYQAYVAETGLTLAWELDALPPEKLSGIFKKAIARYTDFTELDRMRKIENEHKSYFSQFISD